MSDESISTVSLKLKENYEFLAAFEALPDVAPLLLDEPPPLGGASGPSASALLGAAVGNCLAASLLFCLRRSRVEVAGAEAKVAVRVARSEKGRLRITGISVSLEPELAPGQDPAKYDRCLGIFEDFCVVTQSVRAGVPVEVNVSPRQV
ncbi:MAG TPA: OsmC family protein [Vicinamibacterales bacterium]|nr:OsmC family protein [Vicinamibacterales bacterium]HOQ59653.1 OsmC family protein [Vicinamibacterales bacterium]HPK70489.1 OsmC family protein [Vicinamibacterales bacterium]